MEDYMAPSQQHQFVEIDCPETGRPITVARRLDPIGQLFVANQISKHQRDAAEAYRADIEASSLRAPSRGPSDLAGWRGRRPDGHSKHARRLQRAAKDLEPDQIAVIDDALAGRRADLRTLTNALDALAVTYGFSTRTRH
jgi:hypothetical protein